jgi:preprotein translocase subunit SecD
MRKYGISNFIFTILEFCNPDELADKEKKWIKKFNSNNSEYGYNSTPGGDHLTMQSDATKAKKRQAVSAARERKEAARIERNREYHEELEKRRAEAKVEMQRRLEWIEQENLKHPPVVTYVC